MAARRRPAGRSSRPLPGRRRGSCADEGSISSCAWVLGAGKRTGRRSRPPAAWMPMRGRCASRRSRFSAYGRGRRRPPRRPPRSPVCVRRVLHRDRLPAASVRVRRRSRSPGRAPRSRSPRRAPSRSRAATFGGSCRGTLALEWSGWLRASPTSAFRRRFRVARPRERDRCSALPFGISFGGRSSSRPSSRRRYDRSRRTRRSAVAEPGEHLDHCPLDPLARAAPLPKVDATAQDMIDRLAVEA